MRRRVSTAVGSVLATAGAVLALGGCAAAHQQQTTTPNATPAESRAAAESARETAATPAPAAPLGPSTGTGCRDPQDPQLRTVVVEVFPEAGEGDQNVPVPESCQPADGSRGALFGFTSGVLAVEYLPPGGAGASAAPAAAGQPPATGAAAQPGAAGPSPSGAGWTTGVRAATASGGTVAVESRPLGSAPGPFADRLQAIASALAPRL